VARRVVRLGVSLEPELLAALDRWVRERRSPSRSEALRALIRKELVGEALEDPESDAVASLALLYRHDAPNVLERLVAAQHRWGEHVRFATHVHFDNACLEVVVLVGKGREVRAAAEELRSVKGVALGEFIAGTPGIAGGRTGHRHPH
jgi:nickel-responsive transcriptional regulator NikR